MLLEMPYKNRQCHGRGNLGGQLIPDTECSGWKGFWSGHWYFPQWCRSNYRRGRPEWPWRCVSWKNSSKVQIKAAGGAVPGSSCDNFEIDSMAYREPVQTGQNWHDVAVPRVLCNNNLSRFDFGSQRMEFEYVEMWTALVIFHISAPVFHGIIRRMLFSHTRHPSWSYQIVSTKLLIWNMILYDNEKWNTIKKKMIKEKIWYENNDMTRNYIQNSFPAVLVYSKVYLRLLVTRAREYAIDLEILG